MSNTTEIDAALAALGVSQVTALFLSAAPSLPNIRDAEPGDEVSESLRHAEILAGVSAVGFGLCIALVSRTTMPLVMTVGMVAILLVFYEGSLRYHD